MQPYTETPRRRTRNTGNENKPLDVMFTTHSYQGPNETIHAIKADSQPYSHNSARTNRRRYTGHMQTTQL